MSGLIVEESLHRHRLREIADLADDAPGWVYSRWCVDQAFEWMLMNKDPRADDVVRTVLAVAHLGHVEPLLDRPTELQEYGTIVAACDWLVQQLCVYANGGLQDFLDVRAEPGLLDRADRIREWARPGASTASRRCADQSWSSETWCTTSTSSSSTSAPS